MCVLWCVHTFSTLADAWDKVRAMTEAIAEEHTGISREMTRAAERISEFMGKLKASRTVVCVRGRKIIWVQSIEVIIKGARIRADLEVFRGDPERISWDPKFIVS